MATSPKEYPPGDPRLVDKIIGKLKSEGIFDQFRRECLDDVDTKPAYHNLHQRVEGTVNAFLSKQEWRPEMNKNQLRESLRKHIKESGYLDIGVERIVDQVMNPKIMTVFMPHVEDVVYRYVGIDTPGREFLNSRTTAPASSDFSKKKPKADDKKAFDDLLPKDLDPVSPESEADTDFYSNKKDLPDSLDNNVTATPDAPTHTPAIDENSMDSRLSGVSGTTPVDTAEITQRRSSISESQDVENFNNDSQSSKHSLYSSSPVTASSEDLTNRSISQLAKLSINKSHEEEKPQDSVEKMDISESNQITESNNYVEEESNLAVNEPMQCENVEFMDASPIMDSTPTSVTETVDKDLLNKKGYERRKEQTDSGAESSTSKESKESKRDDGTSSVKSSNDSDKHGRSHSDRHKSREEEYRRSKSHKDDRRERDKSKHTDKDHKEKSKDESKHDDSHKDKTKSSEKSHRDKDRKDKDRSYRRDKDSKSSSRENRDDSKDSSDSHRERKDSTKSSKDGGGSHKVKNDNKDGKESSRHHEKKDSKDRKDSYKSSKDSSRSDRDRHRSDKKRDESESDKGKSPHKSDKKSKESKEKSVPDDHHSHRDRHSEDRRSTDRDSNGAASFGSHSSNQKQKSESSSSKDSSTSSQGGNNKNKGKQSADGQTRSSDNTQSTASTVSTNKDFSNKGQTNSKNGTGTKIKEPEKIFVAPKLMECDMFNPIKPKKVLENRRISSGNVNNTPVKQENSTVKQDSVCASNSKIKSEESEKGPNTPKQKVAVKRESVDQENIVVKQKSTVKQESVDQEMVVPKQEKIMKQESLNEGTVIKQETLEKAECVTKDESSFPKREKNESSQEVEETSNDNISKHVKENSVNSSISSVPEETKPVLILKPDIVDLTLSPTRKRDSSENIITTPTTPISPSSSLPFKKRPVTPSSKNSSDVEQVSSVGSENKLLLKKKSKLVTDTLEGKKQTRGKKRQASTESKNLMECDSTVEGIKELPTVCENKHTKNGINESLVQETLDSESMVEDKEDKVEDLKYFRSEGDNFFLSGKESKFLNYVYNICKVVDRSFVTLSLACMFNDIVKTAKEMGVEICDTPNGLMVKETADTTNGSSASTPSTSRTPRKNTRSGRTTASTNVTNQKLQISPTVEKRELRRTRKPNNRYSSEEYASIFSESENTPKKSPGDNLPHSKVETPLSATALRRLSESMDIKNCHVAISKIEDTKEHKIKETDNLHDSCPSETKAVNLPTKENNVNNTFNSVSPTKQANNNNESFFNPKIFTSETVTSNISESPNQKSSTVLSNAGGMSEIPKITHTIGAFEVTIESDNGDSDDEDYIEDECDTLQQELILPSLEDLMRESGMIPPTKVIDTSSLVVDATKLRQMPRTRYVGLPPPPKKKAALDERNSNSNDTISSVSAGADSNSGKEPENSIRSNDLGDRDGIKDTEESTPTNTRRNSRRTVNEVVEVRSTRGSAAKRRGSGTSDNIGPTTKRRR